MDRKLDPKKALENALQTYASVAASIPETSWPPEHRNDPPPACRIRDFTGEDPLPNAEEIDRIPGEGHDPGPSNQNVFNSLGNTQLYLAKHRASTGQDPAPDYRNAIESYRRELKHNPTFTFAYNNIGEAYAQWARYETDKGRDPWASCAARGRR